jgi:competence protein ComEC
MKKTEKLWIFLFLFLIVLGISCSAWLGRAVSPDYLFVHFINVGYGDSIFVEFPDGANMLIDGGNREAGVRVSDYLKERKIKKLDLVVITHPHPDHMEGLFSVVQKYKIDNIIANEDISESKGYLPFFLR